MEEYDDSQIGALEEGDAETARDCNLLLEKAADDLQRYHMYVCTYAYVHMIHVVHEYTCSTSQKKKLCLKSTVATE